MNLVEENRGRFDGERKSDCLTLVCSIALKIPYLISTKIRA
jgi:hypothetical protein